MSFSADLACFEAKAISLRRGRRSIWEEANWRIQGPTVILGSNGTGKSSTLAMLAGHLTPNSGVLSFSLGENQISPDVWMTQIALAAPWAEVPSHLTLAEAIAFHGTFRQPRKGDLHWIALLERAGLDVGESVPIRMWSSGQKQRLHLALAMGTASPVVLLDEPGSNLDQEGIQWMRSTMDAILEVSTVVVATNDEKKEAPKGASLLRI